MKAVLFDIYGTLIEFNTPRYHSPYGNLIGSLGLSREERALAVELILTQHLPTMRDAINLLQQTFPGNSVHPANLEQAEEELQEHLDSAVLCEGATEILSALHARNYRLCLVSNLATPYKKPIYALGLDEMVDETVYSCEVGWMKPHPEIFRKALEAVESQPWDAVFVGDTLEDDIYGAAGVGIRGILVDKEAPLTGHAVHHLKDLFFVLEQDGESRIGVL